VELDIRPSGVTDKVPSSTELPKAKTSSTSTPQPASGWTTTISPPSASPATKTPTMVFLVFNPWPLLTCRLLTSSRRQTRLRLLDLLMEQVPRPRKPPLPLIPPLHRSNMYAVEGFPSRSLRQQRRRGHGQAARNLPPQRLAASQLASPLDPLRHRARVQLVLQRRYLRCELEDGCAGACGEQLVHWCGEGCCY
jgi:hypothetical protein